MCHFINSIFIRSVDDEDDCSSALKVRDPRGYDTTHPAKIPRQELHILVLKRLHAEVGRYNPIHSVMMACDLVEQCRFPS